MLTLQEKKPPYVVVRTHSAGVHVGELLERNGKEVLLGNARRIYEWHGAFTLHAVASQGVAANSRISVVVPSILLTEAIEIIGTTERGEKCLREFADAGK